MTLQITRVLALIIFLFSGVLSQADDKAILHAVADAYDENKAKFAFGASEFAFDDGFSRSLEHARKGDFKESHKASGKYIFDANEHRCFEKIYPLADLVAVID